MYNNIINTEGLQMQQTLQHAGQTVYINVSPCSWMYLDYGLQFSLSLRENAPNCACEFVLHKEKAGMHKDDMPTFARVFAQAWLEANGLSKLEAFVLDICEVEGGLRIVEINTLNSAGFYAADVQRLVMALEDAFN